MIIYPAIDLMGGCCVRLMQGRFDEVTVYDAKPAAALAGFAEAGAEWAHVVDLDGARAGCPVQHALIAGLTKASTMRLQVAGGFRTREQVKNMFECGAARIVIGSLAIEQATTVCDLLDEFGSERIALALDVNFVLGQPIVASRGWTKSSGENLFDSLAKFPAARHVLVTDIARDGMQAGANVELMRSLARTFPNLQVQASGGVRSLEDLRDLGRAGAAGAILGKSLWERELDLGEALARASA